MSSANRPPADPGVRGEPQETAGYGDYLRLDALLSCQHPVSGQHDEMLFIIQHQTTELWLKLLIHELGSAMRRIAADDLAPALKALARVKHIQRQMFEQWAVLETLTPAEYAQFRGALGSASGLQSSQYRMVEFLLGNKDARRLDAVAHQGAGEQELRAVLRSPSLYDEFLRYLARRGHDVPAELVERDWSRPHQQDSGLLPVLREIYERPQRHWSEYEMCEALVDVEESFQLWRFRHVKTVQRIIGGKRGTGGSGGVDFLEAALELTFFPEVLLVRDEIREAGDGASPG